MGVDAPKKTFKSEEVQCELLKESNIVFEDKDMQIVFPTAVAQIVVQPTAKDSSNQTRLTKQTLESLVFFTEIVSIKPIAVAKEYSPAEIQTEEVVAQEASIFGSEIAENVKSSQGENEEEKKQEEIREVEEENKLQLFAQSLITEISISPQK